MVRGRRAAKCAALAGLLLTGCYTLQPVDRTKIQVGTKVAFDVNDVGRVSLGELVGPEIGRIDGLLVGQESGEYYIAVSGVQLLRGGEQVWTGERVRLKSEYVSTVYERRFHKGRTIALSAAVVGGLAALVVSQDLFGLGTTGRPDPCCDSIPQLIFRRR
jgi:hypothetical protein